MMRLAMPASRSLIALLVGTVVFFALWLVALGGLAAWLMCRGGWAARFFLIQAAVPWLLALGISLYSGRSIFVASESGVTEDSRPITLLARDPANTDASPFISPSKPCSATWAGSSFLSEAPSLDAKMHAVAGKG